MLFGDAVLRILVMQVRGLAKMLLLLLVRDTLREALLHGVFEVLEECALTLSVGANIKIFARNPTTPTTIRSGQFKDL